MEYIIGGVLAIIVIITIGLLLRKKLYDAIDHYEDWKLDIMNRNVAGELAKMKELNVEGDTKERFDRWRQAWEEILTVDLANVEELLYDTEKAADRYNFPAAKKKMNKMEAILVDIENRIETILTELHALLQTEEKNREVIEALEPRIEEMAMHLSKNRLEYHHAEARFETALNDIKLSYDTYNEQIADGNYLEGTAIVDEMGQQIDFLEQELEEFPYLYKKCKQVLPLDLDELLKGIHDMKQQGYAVEDLHLEEEIKNYQPRLVDMVKELENQGAESVRTIVPEMEARITEMYDMLEQEAIARNYVEAKVPSYERTLDQIETAFMMTQNEVEELKEAYYFEEEDLEQFVALDNKLTQLKEKLASFTEKVAENTSAHSKLKVELEEAFTQLESIDIEHQEFKKIIQNLRKDEIEAREQIKEMNEEIYKTSRKIKSSNLPGIPDKIWGLIEEAKENNERVLLTLDEQPLDMMDVQQSLTTAKESVTYAIENTNKMLEQAHLTEHVIQYANRYRSSYPELAAKLVESENLFRKSEYELSLEGAARALEEIEPGALKKVEKYQEQTVS